MVYCILGIFYPYSSVQPPVSSRLDLTVETLALGSVLGAITSMWGFHP
jgi:hypothetical protein